MSVPSFLVVPIGEEHIEGFRAALDSVAPDLGAILRRRDRHGAVSKGMDT